MQAIIPAFSITPTRAIELTPENIKAYYWLVCAMTKLDCSELAKNEIAHAKRCY